MERVVVWMGFVFIFLSWGSAGDWYYLLCEGVFGLVEFGDVEMEIEIEIDMYNV